MRELSRELDRLGLKVAVAARTPYATAEDAAAATPTKMVRLWAPRRPALEALTHSFIAILYAAVTRPRLVHIHAIGPGVMLPLARLLGLKVIATHHGEDYRREKWGPLASFVLRCGEACQARFAHGVICVSKSLSARLACRYGRAFSAIPNGVPRPGLQPPSGILEKLALQPQGYIVTVSRLVPEKRQLDLIHAFSKLGRNDLKLVLVGAADRETDYSRKVAEAAARTGNVILAGKRKGAELRDLLENAAVFALPSSHEGLPIALLEAMSHGVRVVVSDIEGHRDMGLPEDSYHAVGDTGALRDRLAKQIARAAESRPDWSARLQEHRWDIIARKSLEQYRRIDPKIGAPIIATAAASRADGQKPA